MDRLLKTLKDTEEFGAELLTHLAQADTVLLYGDLGVGKTTLVRAMLRSLGYLLEVRSPTFSLIQIYETDPPILHADLYRLTKGVGIGLEDYLDTHLCLIEWPDRALDLLDPEDCWQVWMEFAGDSRKVSVMRPK